MHRIPRFPRLDGKTLILADPMLATGAWMELSYRALLPKASRRMSMWRLS